MFARAQLEQTDWQIVACQSLSRRVGNDRIRPRPVDLQLLPARTVIEQGSSPIQLREWREDLGAN